MGQSNTKSPENSSALPACSTAAPLPVGTPTRKAVVRPNAIVQAAMSFDPRSPSAQISRTPLAAATAAAARRRNSVTKPNAVVQAAMSFDPRSPSAQISRTPLAAAARRHPAALLDPRSPSTSAVARTPLPTSAAHAQRILADVRSPTALIARTPIYSAIIHAAIATRVIEPLASVTDAPAIVEPVEALSSFSSQLFESTDQFTFAAPVASTSSEIEAVASSAKFMAPSPRTSSKSSRQRRSSSESGASLFLSPVKETSSRINSAMPGFQLGASMVAKSPAAGAADKFSSASIPAMKRLEGQSQADAENSIGYQMALSMVGTTPSKSAPGAAYRIPSSPIAAQHSPVSQARRAPRSPAVMLR
jgi:hypothetical protein